LILLFFSVVSSGMGEKRFVRDYDGDLEKALGLEPVDSSDCEFHFRFKYPGAIIDLQRDNDRLIGYLYTYLLRSKYDEFNQLIFFKDSLSNNQSFRIFNLINNSDVRKLQNSTDVEEWVSLLNDYSIYFNLKDSPRIYEAYFHHPATYRDSSNLLVYRFENIVKTGTTENKKPKIPDAIIATNLMDSLARIVPLSMSEERIRKISRMPRYYSIEMQFYRISQQKPFRIGYCGTSGISKGLMFDMNFSTYKLGHHWRYSYSYNTENEYRINAYYNTGFFTGTFFYDLTDYLYYIGLSPINIRSIDLSLEYDTELHKRQNDFIAFNSLSILAEFGFYYDTGTQSLQTGLGAKFHHGKEEQVGFAMQAAKYFPRYDWKIEAGANFFKGDTEYSAGVSKLIEISPFFPIHSISLSLEYEKLIEFENINYSVMFYF
jgi:hypothetical protein